MLWNDKLTSQTVILGRSVCVPCSVSQSPYWMEPDSWEKTRNNIFHEWHGEMLKEANALYKNVLADFIYGGKNGGDRAPGLNGSEAQRKISITPE